MSDAIAKAFDGFLDGMADAAQAADQLGQWINWKAELLAEAEKAGWPAAHVETDAYRAYFDDGYSARDAWDEDMQHA